MNHFTKIIGMVSVITIMATPIYAFAEGTCKHQGNCHEGAVSCKHNSDCCSDQCKGIKGIKKMCVPCKALVAPDSSTSDPTSNAPSDDASMNGPTQ